MRQSAQLAELPRLPRDEGGSSLKFHEEKYPLCRAAFTCGTRLADYKWCGFFLSASGVGAIGAALRGGFRRVVP